MILDDLRAMAKLDKTHMRDSIMELGAQCEQAWKETQQINLQPTTYNLQPNGLAICGMGGSGIGGNIIKYLLGRTLKIPLEIVNEYELPGWVNRHSLVILSSYSGTTEETLTAAREAKHREAKCFAISAGGDLEIWAKKYRVPFYKIVPTHNPSNQPRMALGYSIIGQMGLLVKAGLIHANLPAGKAGKADINNIIKTIYTIHTKTGPGIPTKQNPVKQLAQQLQNAIPLLIGAEPLGGNLRTLRNQINENAKHNCFYLLLPELNHHALEGLRFPKAQRRLLRPVLIRSKLYPAVIQKRLAITAEVLIKNGLKPLWLDLRASTPLLQSFELLTLGSWLGFYLAMLHKINPAPIPWVEYFKKRLTK